MQTPAARAAGFQEQWRADLNSVAATKPGACSLCGSPARRLEKEHFVTEGRAEQRREGEVCGEDGWGPRIRHLKITHVHVSS